MFENQVDVDDIKELDVDDIKNLDEASQWRSCCCKKSTDSRLLKYATQYALIFSVFIFCLAMLTKGRCDDRGTYLNLLSLLIGIVLPTPSH